MKVLIIGGVNIDIIANTKTIQKNDSNIADIDISFGGVARNICENLARLNQNISFITAIGNDALGMSLYQDLKSLNVDLQHTLLINERSGLYIAINDNEGDMAIAVCDNRIIEKLNQEYLQKIKTYLNSFDYLVLDTNLSEEAIKYLFENVTKKICVDATSNAKAKKIFPYLNKIHLLKCNNHEATVLTNNLMDPFHQINFLLNQNVFEVVITQGVDPVIYNDGKQIKTKEVVASKKIVSTTGCGDAFMSGLIYGKLNNLSKDDTISIASKMAKMTLEVKEACHKEIYKVLT